MKIEDIKENPDNPRTIKKSKFRKLVNSINNFPQMLELRPIVVDENNVVLGGNMRLKALQEAEITQVRVIRAEDLTPEQKREFIIKDNVGFGDWDIDMLANQWDLDSLIDWGMDAKDFDMQQYDEPVDESEYDEEPIYPIVPRMTEKYDYVMILAENEIDYTFLRTFFELEDMEDYKSTKIGMGRVVEFEKFKRLLDERSSQAGNTESQEG